MKHLKPIAAGVGVLLAAALVAGCGGGGHGSGTLAGVGSNSGSTGGGTTAQSSSTAAITITVKIPPSSQTASYRRNPAYISPATYSIEAYAEPSNISNSAQCSGSTCTLTLSAPLTTTSIKVQLFDSSYDLLSMATDPVTITQGAANAFTFVFNGIVSVFHVFSTLAQGVIGISQSGTLTVVPYDAAGDEIMAPGPGALIDSNGNVLVSADGTTQTMSLTKSGNDTSYLTIGALTWNTNTYQLSATETYNDGGAGTQGGMTITAGSSASSDFTLVPYVLPVNPPAISVIANPSNPTAYQVSVGTLGSATNTNIELPTVPTPSPVSVGLSIVSNFNDASAELALTNDTCTNYTPSNTFGLGLDAAFPSPAPTMPSSLSYPFTLNIAAPNPTGYSNMSCSFTITDTTNNLSANGTFYFTGPTLNINGKNRK
jgi:hypothetical protein